MHFPGKTKKFPLAAAFSGLLALTAPARAQNQPPALEVVRAAVQAELAANVSDKSVWEYRDHDAVPEKDALYYTIETPQGMLKRLLSLNGQALTNGARDAESDRLAKSVHDEAGLARQKKAAAHDDAQATELTKILPDAFLWTIRSQTPQFVTLEFRPNPGFEPPNMEARVLGAMAGEMVVARNGNRIRTLRGALSYDVKIGFGILGKLNQGGAFEVQRREIIPGHWQITETHVHIGGHALLFKTIGQQEDEVKTDWKPSPAHTMQEAEQELRKVQ